MNLASWQNFYEIAGSAAGALTGLQFVVLALIAQSRKQASMREIRAFGTPTIVLFCAALLISALMSAPWPATEDFAICLGIGGLLGVIYSIGIFWHAQKAKYDPVVEDWIWYAIVPFLSQAVLIAAAVMLMRQIQWSLWVVAGDTLLILLTGIRNSWDTITFVVVEHTGGSKE